MAPSAQAEASTQFCLQAQTAAELMTPNPISLRAGATIAEAISFLIDKGFSAAPVIDEAGHPVGVVSSWDILAHQREQPHGTAASAAAEAPGAASPGLAAGNQARVGDIMTPVVFSVAPDTPAKKAIQEMVSLRLHRLFVVEAGGSLVGVVTASDILRQLR